LKSSIEGEEVQIRIADPLGNPAGSGTRFFQLYFTTKKKGSESAWQ